MKTCKKLLALLLALAMIFAFAACDNSKDGDKDDDKGSSNIQETNPPETDPPTEPPKEEEKLYGDWTMVTDAAGVMNEVYAMSFGDTFALPESPINVSMTLSFGEDGAYTLDMELDTDSFDAYMTELSASLVAYLYDTYEALGYSEADVTAELGMTVEEYVASAFAVPSDDMVDELDDMDLEGCYKLEDDELFLAEDEDDLEDEKDSMTISLDGDKMEVTDIDGDELEELEDYMKDNYDVKLPWTFEKV